MTKKRLFGLVLLLVSILTAIGIVVIENGKMAKPLDIKDAYEKGNYVKFTMDNIIVAARTKKIGKEFEDYQFDEPGSKENIYFATDINNEYIMIKTSGDKAKEFLKVAKEYDESGKMDDLIIEGKVDEMPDTVYSVYKNQLKDFNYDPVSKEEAKIIITNKYNMYPKYIYGLIVLFLVGLRNLIFKNKYLG